MKPLFDKFSATGLRPARYWCPRHSEHRASAGLELRNEIPVSCCRACSGVNDDYYLLVLPIALSFRYASVARSDLASGNLLLDSFREPIASRFGKIDEEQLQPRF